MKYELKKLSLKLNSKELYDMYQDIPNGENGQTNNAYGLNEEEFRKYLLKQIKRENNKFSY